MKCWHFERFSNQGKKNNTFIPTWKIFSRLKIFSRCFPGFFPKFSNSRCFPGLSRVDLKFQVFQVFPGAWEPWKRGHALVMTLELTPRSRKLNNLQIICWWCNAPILNKIDSLVFKMLWLYFGTGGQTDRRRDTRSKLICHI